MEIAEYIILCGKSLAPGAAVDDWLDICLCVLVCLFLSRCDLFLE